MAIRASIRTTILGPIMVISREASFSLLPTRRFPTLRENESTAPLGGTPYRPNPNRPHIKPKKNLKESIISEGVVPGTIQIPGNAQPIIILGETVTGGYRKVATVISADLPFLGQLKPGDTVSFRKVCMDEAYRAIGAVSTGLALFQSSVSPGTRSPF